MKFARKTIFYAATVLAFAVPINHNVNAASSSQLQSSYQAYPTPAMKPQLCMKQEMRDETYIDKKQAAAAALGLYLGIRQATAPKTEQDKKNLCV